MDVPVSFRPGRVVLGEGERGGAAGDGGTGS